MKQITKPISDFFLAFNLENPVKGVCFNAPVFFTSDKLVIQIESEIHIITIAYKMLDIIYMLNPAISLKGFPDMFESENWEIAFKENKGLIIKGPYAQKIKYSILIQPAGKDCEPATLEYEKSIKIN